MADMRDRLIELLESARYWGCGTSTEIADHLLANGVILPEWILVEDRLPEQPGMYLVTGRSYGTKTPKIWVCECMKIGPLVGWCNNALNPCVKAWMPLPEPPKEAEKALKEKENG